MEDLRIEAGLSLADILASLSYALDLTSGQPMGHAQRTCLIGMRLGDAIGLPEDQLVSLYHALLMKDAGCSSNAARMYEIFGSDDISAKRMSKITDWSNLLEAAKYVAANTFPESTLIIRARRMLHIVTHKSQTTDALMHARCDRGAQIALFIGLGEASAGCIRHLDEHWDGNGGPYHLTGDNIPLLSRITCLAQTLEVFASTFDVETAYAMIQKRSAKWFDPELVRLAIEFKDDDSFWNSVQNDTRETLLRIEVRTAIETTTDSHIDTVCDAFAQIVDAKSSFTAEHSSRVRDYTVEMAEALGIQGKRLSTLSRAALLHDVGKLGVSNAILDKPGKPDDDEWAAIKRHPEYTQKILSHIPGFARLTEIAAAHHERLDGKGYFRGLTADQLDLDMRILAVADVFDALTAKRPYRDALPLVEVYKILDRDAGAALDADCIAALKAIHPALGTETLYLEKVALPLAA